MSTGDKIVFKDKKKENINLTGGEVFLTDSDFAIILNPKNFANTILKIAKEENIEIMKNDIIKPVVEQIFMIMYPYFIGIGCIFIMIIIAIFIILFLNIKICYQK